MKIATQSSVLLAGACLQWAVLAAESEGGIWRCGSSYSDRPCQEGRPLDIDDGRSDEQKRAADQHTRDARALADRMERERLRLEAAQARRGLVVIGDASASEANSKAAAARQANKELRLRPRKDPVYRAPPDPSAPPKRAKQTRKAAAKKQQPMQLQPSRP